MHLSLQRLYREAVVHRNGLYAFNGTTPPWVLPMLRERRAVAMLNKYFSDSVHVSHVGFWADHSHLMYVKGTRIGAVLDLHLGQMKAMGMMKKWLRDVTPVKKQPSSVLANSNHVQLSFAHLLPAFLILAAGVVISIAAFVLEQLVWLGRYQHVEVVKQNVAVWLHMLI